MNAEEDVGVSRLEIIDYLIIYNVIKLHHISYSLISLTTSVKFHINNLPALLIVPKTTLLFPIKCIS